jgi:hypothetical protein
MITDPSKSNSSSKTPTKTPDGKPVVPQAPPSLATNIGRAIIRAANRWTIFGALLMSGMIIAMYFQGRYPIHQQITSGDVHVAFLCVHFQ